MTPMTRRPAARRSLSALGLGALAIAALGAFALPAAAQTPRGAGPGFMLDFDAIDADGDGRITLDEIRAYRQARAAALDADGDGFVTRDELLAFRLAEARTRIERQVDRVFAQLDLDGDGRLGAAELLAGQATGARRGPDLERMFARIDRNGDGAQGRKTAQPLVSAAPHAPFPPARTRAIGPPHVRFRPGILARTRGDGAQKRTPRSGLHRRGNLRAVRHPRLPQPRRPGRHCAAVPIWSPIPV